MQSRLLTLRVYDAGSVPDSPRRCATMGTILDLEILMKETYVCVQGNPIN